MRRFVCAVLCFALCLSLAVPAFAAFAPSVAVKETPVIEKVVDNAGKEVKNEKGVAAIATFVTDAGEKTEEKTNVYEGSLVITSVSDAKAGKVTDKKDEQLTKHEKEIQQELKKIHDDVSKGKEKIPFAEVLEVKDESKIVVRELFALTWHPGEEHGIDGEHFEKLLAEEGNELHITLDLGVAKNDKVYIMVYAHHEGDKPNEKSWKRVEVVNNGDGTVTAEFESLGVVAVCIEN